MPTAADLVIRAQSIVSGGRSAPGAIGISDGRINFVGALEAAIDGSEEIRLGAGVVVMPGLVDSHVHISEPGTTWEGFASATTAAAAGGITTVVDMPLDSVPSTVDVDALEAKRSIADGQCHIDVGFWGGVVPGNLDELPALHRAGVLGFKCFLTDSGTADFPPVSVEEMREAMEVLRQLGSPLLVHAESAEVHPLQVHSRRYSDYLASRPRGCENLAVAQVIEAARVTGARAHIVHLSSSDAVDMIESARREGVAVSAETCPHYLTLCSEEIADGATATKCSPPVREADNREALWRAIGSGVVDMVVSDHSPCSTDMKRLDTGDFYDAWGGISSIQIGLPLIWTEARRRGHGLIDVARWMADRPARTAGLGNKGRIDVGYDADICIFAPDESFVVEPQRLHHRHKQTPYEGRVLTGNVLRTMLRGKWVNVGERPRGELLVGAGARR